MISFPLVIVGHMLNSSLLCRLVHHLNLLLSKPVVLRETAKVLLAVWHDFQVGQSIDTFLPGVKFRVILFDDRIFVLEIEMVRHQRSLTDPNITLGPFQEVLVQMPRAEVRKVTKNDDTLSEFDSLVNSEGHGVRHVWVFHGDVNMVFGWDNIPAASGILVVG